VFCDWASSVTRCCRPVAVVSSDFNICFATVGSSSMGEDKDIEMVRARAGEVDDIAAQEAIEDERVKTEQQQTGGTLEVKLARRHTGRRKVDSR
jgi:hypothetical protein